MRNLLILVNDIHFKGGGERVASYIASWYSRKGDNVTLLSMSIKRDTPIYPLDSRVKICYLNVVHDKFLSKTFVLRKLRLIVKQNPVDIIMGIGTYANVLLGMIKCNNAKIIGCEHNSFHSVSLIWKLLRKMTYGRLDAVTVLTHTDLEDMKKLNPLCYVIPNSVPFTSKYSTLKNKQIVAIGKLYSQKGFDLMLDVCSIFFKSHMDWHLDIIGDGPDKMKILKKIRKLNLDNHVTLIPPTLQIEKEYLRTSIYLMTSRYEGLPMVLLEAQSYGIPIVSYDCDTGPRDIINHGVDGYLIKMGEEKEMAEALCALADSWELRKQMGKQALINAKRFSPEVIFSLWDKLFDSLT